MISSRAVAAVALSLMVARPAAPQSAPGPADARVAAVPKVSDWVLRATEAGREADLLVVLSRQADLSGAAALPSREEKGRFVRDALLRTAQATQGPLLELLARSGVPHRPFFIVNAIAVTARREVALLLAGRPDVSRVEGNPRVPVDLPRSESAAHRTARATTDVEPNITQCRAPDVWALGDTGQGIVIGGQDTGVAWTHPALEPAYRGWNGTTASHDYNWHDAIHASTGPCGHDAVAPCDDTWHGTHTMGTVLGLDGPNQIGMAPGAKWIGCRNMDSDAGSPATYLECFQFFLAPYPVWGSPLQGDPAKAPHVTNNSWACPPSEGCGALTLEAAVAAQRAAGIFTSASAGNSGPACSSVTLPPAIYDEVFTVGATQLGTGSLIASFSGRGPVTIDGSGRVKPDIVAPGVSVLSCTLGGGYVTASGTSMASPHVAGAVALVWSAQPALVGQIDQTERILADSAVPVASTDCGETSRPNDTFGWGFLDAKAAVDLALVRPILSGLSPSLGSVQGGTAVTITGANFVSGAGVTFGGAAATSVVVVDPGRITARTPPHGAANVDVAVTNPDTQAGTLAGGFAYTASPPPPSVFAIVPNDGPTAGGTAVSITGANFVDGATVSIGGVAATGAWFVSSTTLTATTGPHAAGTVNVVVTNPDTQTGMYAKGYSYTPPPSASEFYALAPCRILDTRNANGPLGGPALAGSGARRTFTVAGTCGVPSSATSVSVNLTVTRSSAAGGLTVYRGDGNPTGTTSISFASGRTRANNAIFALATDGTGSIGVENDSASTVHVILDVNGYFQ